MNIREEIADDITAIEAITVEAFQDHPHSANIEQFIIRSLRNSGQLALSLVAEVDGRVVGHIAFSVVKISDHAEGWFGLGPVSVAKSRQGQGIGSLLVQTGLETIQALGAHGCVVLGEPGFYHRFGFMHVEQLTLADVPPEHFQALTFTEQFPSGSVDYDVAFYEPYHDLNPLPAIN